MFRAWLLIVWLGSDSNFTLVESFEDHAGCDQRRSQILTSLDSRFTAICTQEMQQRHLLRYQKQDQHKADK